MRRVLVLVVIALLAAVGASTATATAVPGACQNDSKLIGPILVSTADEEGTWWWLTKNGLIAIGADTDAEQLATINGWFGTSFTELTDAVDLLVSFIVPLDKNGNGFVCASNLRGVRAVAGDPNLSLTAFSVIDDKHVKPS